MLILSDRSVSPVVLTPGPTRVPSSNSAGPMSSGTNKNLNRKGAHAMRKTLISPSILLLIFSLFVAHQAVAQGTLRVGAARVDITPPSDPANPSTGKYAHEKLYARAIVLDTGATRAALIGVDLGGLSEVIWQVASKQIATELKCPIENIIMSATHTHSGWGPGGFRGLTDSNAPPPPIIGQMVDAVRQAKAKLQPARVGFGTGNSYLNVNRDAIDPETHLWTQAPNLDGPSDKTVAVVVSGGERPTDRRLHGLRHASGEWFPQRTHQRGLRGGGVPLCGAGVRRQAGRGFRAGRQRRPESAVSPRGYECVGLA